ncbi:hypothetical protein J7F03_28935 [Streptomyces sp. ISL-43]|uniref:hypothetical protein n=1 Tax=Streptomyces sp. ISL-43 TaxID=2819183 RepID=UPI001BE9ED1F|nr:hypothetical protein [Streptomyces sp. ISL-43]MBT2451031.1 hypothetical protein [Streptomyces sp. ISL-43]
MDVGTAMRVIREQDRVARYRLRPLLDEQGRRCDAVAASLEPWLGKAWKWSRGQGSLLEPRGFLRPEAYTALREAQTLMDRRGRTRPHPLWQDLEKAVDCLDYRPPALWIIENEHGARYQIFSTESSHLPKDRVDQAVAELIGNIRKLATAYREDNPARLIKLPEEIHPPRHAVFAEGILARLFVEDLNAWIENCREIEEAVVTATAVSPAILEWRDSTSLFLGRHLGSEVKLGFDSLMKSAPACGSPLIADVHALGRACMALGLAYLEEVRGRMPDYVEASGQATPEPRVSLTFSGGNYYGGQFAAQISNIHSSVAGVHQDGGAGIADALTALGQAVLAQENLDDDQRRDLLDNVEYLAGAAGEPPERRNRGIIRSALNALNAAAVAGTGLGAAMEAWSGVLHRLAL